MKWLRTHQFRRTTLWLLLCVAFLCGLGLARGGHSISALWFALGTAGLVVTPRRRTVWTALFIIVLGLSFGSQRGTEFTRKLDAYNPYYGHKITVIAQASDDAVYGKNSQLTFDATNMRLANGQKLAGKWQVSGFGLNAVFQGDDLAVSGKLYPGFGAYQGEMSFAQLIRNKL